MTAEPFTNHRQAALALLSRCDLLNRKEGGFLGQLATDDTALTGKQAIWLNKLLERAGLPLLGAEHAS